MVDIEVDVLLAPVSEENPVGEDLDGSPARFAIEEAFARDQVAADDDGAAAEDVDWAGIAAAIVAQFAQSKDLWLATYLMRAGAKLGDMAVVVAGAQTLTGLLDLYWDTVHPQLDLVDFIGRKAPCEALTKVRDFLGPLRNTVLIEHPRLGRFTGEDFIRFNAEGAEAEGYGMFRNLIGSQQAEVRDALDKIDALARSIHEADTTLTSHSGSDTSTNFEPTYQALKTLRAAVAPFVTATTEGGEEDATGIEASAPEEDEVATDGEDEDAFDVDAAADDSFDLDLDLDLGDAAAADDDDDDDDADTGSSSSFGTSGEITSRDDVAAAIEAIIAYYEAREPNSPVPTLMKRARSWMDMDFMALLADFAPEGAADARKVLGIKDDEGGSGGSDTDADSGFGSLIDDDGF